MLGGVGPRLQAKLLGNVSQLRNGENIIGDEENMRCKHALVGIPFNIAS